MAVTRGPLNDRPFRINWEPSQDKPYEVIVPRAVSANVVAPTVPQVPRVPPRQVSVAGRRVSGQDNFDPLEVLSRARGQQADTGQVEYPEVTQADVDAAVSRVQRAARESGVVTGTSQREIEQDIEAAIRGEQRGPLATLSNLVSFLPESIEKPVRQAGADFTQSLFNTLSVPGRVVQSYAKEVSDIFTEGEAPSLKEFVTQPFDFENFNPEYAPVESFGELFGQDWSDNRFVQNIDKALDFGAKVLADPTTYFLATPMKYQGQAGRGAAAEDFLGSVFASRVDDATRAKLAGDIYRYGPDALPTNVRNAMTAEGIYPRAGVRIAGVVVPGTEAGATRVAAGLGGARARLGDVGGGAAAAAITPESRAGLVGVARGEVSDPDQVLNAFAANKAVLAAKADAGQYGAELAGRYQPLARQLSGLDGENQRLLIDFAEGSVENINVIPTELRGLAGLMREAYDQVLADYNARRIAFSEAHGLRLEEVPTLQNYVHRTATPEAQTFFSSRRGQQFARRIASDFGLDVPSLRSAEGFTMTRTIKGTFLGERLQTGPVLRTLKDGTQVRAGTINEINNIAVDKMGFRLFEDNAGKAFASYLRSITRQFQRESFLDNLLRARPTAVKPLLGTGPTASKIRSVIDGYEEMLVQIERNITGGAGVPKGTGVRAQGQAAVRDVANTVREISSPLFANSRKAKNAVRQLSRKLDQLSERIALIRNEAEFRRVELDQSALAVLEPLEARIGVLQRAVDAGEGAQAAAREWLLRRHTELFPDVLVRPSAPAQLADDILRDAGGRLSGAARAGAERRTLAAREAAGPRPMVDVAGQQATLPEARAELKRAVSAYKKEQAAYRKAINNDPTLKEYGSLQERQVRLTAKLDAAAAIDGAFDQWQQTVGDLWRKDIADIRGLLDDMPKASAGAKATSEWLSKVADTFNSLQVAELSEGQRETITRVMAQLFGEEAALAKITDDIIGGQQLEAAVRQGLVDPAYTEDIIKGWKTLRDFNVQVSPEMAEQIDGVYQGLVDDIVRASSGDGQTLLGELYDASLKYFKSTAVLTLGFTVRNAITAAWNNWVNGVTLSQYNDAVFRYRPMIKKYGLEGAYKRLPEQEAARLRSAMNAVFATGGGRNVDEIIPVTGRAARRRFNNSVADAGAGALDYVFRPFAGYLSAGARRLNEGVEVAFARLPLALNGVDQGYSVQANAARIARTQFDYTDLSPLDRAVKNVIPFWVFSSRNIPLQLVNRVTRPGPYLIYERLSESEEQDRRLALWRAERGPIPFLGGFLDLDLPFQTLNEQIANLTSLTGWLGQTAPQIRTPIEVATGERIAFGTSYPYSSEFQPVDLSLGNLPASLYAIATGQTERTAEGGLVAPETVTGPIGSAFPAFRNVQTYGAAIVMATGQSPESRLGRIIGADEKYYERGLPNLAAQLSGINYYRLTPEDVSRENRRRIAEVNQLERELQQLGYLP